MTKRQIHKTSEEYYLSIKKDVYYTIIDEKAIIFVSLDNSFYNLNSVGTKIWELADGVCRVREIIDIISEEFGINRNIVAKDVLGFIKDLSKKQLVNLSKNKRLI
jgi:hypothetical protein